MTADREHGIVVYGATGYVGELVAAHLAGHAPAGVRIGLAGRSRDRLQAVRNRLPARARDWPLLVADSTDGPALAALAASTRVLLTTVGPYARYGMGVVEACAAAGTHYADLTGEVLFHREAIDRCDAVARASGARLVHSCGYDSIPSDLGVYLAHRRAGDLDAGPLTEVLAVATARGGLSGGTLDSMRAQREALDRDPALRATLRDPHALSPDPGAEPTGSQPPDLPGPSRRGRIWTAPFVMAPYNTRVVRRSNSLLGHAYGTGLRYGEVMGVGRGPSGAVGAAAVSAGLAAFAAGFSSARLRPLLDRVLPAPGSGPSERTRSRGWFRTDVDAGTASGERIGVSVSGRGDPGYSATAVMLGESGLCLALDADRLPDRAGSLTPATAMGDALVERLRAAGHRYELTEPVAGT
jgi:short subunit dehydrogenase-like uncharacterized protein